MPLGLILLALLAAPVADSTCPYYYTAPEKAPPAWMKHIALLRANLTPDQRAVALVNWTVPLRWGGKFSPDNLMVIAKADIEQKLKAEEFLAHCMCEGPTSVDYASKAIVYWRSHLAGEMPFPRDGQCPVAP